MRCSDGSHSTETLNYQLGWVQKVRNKNERCLGGGTGESFTPSSSGETCTIKLSENLDRQVPRHHILQASRIDCGRDLVEIRWILLKRLSSLQSAEYLE